MDDGTPEPRCCEVCGKQLRRNNYSGICSTSPGCRQALKARRAAGTTSGGGRKQCSHPDGCPNLSRRNGLCEMHDRRVKKTGELGPAGLIRKPLEIPAGTAFGLWVTLEDHDKSKRRISCRCACGNVKPVDAWALKGGTSRSCGCPGRGASRRLPGARIYLPAGTVSGRLTALEDAALAADDIRFRCECGNETVKNAYSVKNGKTRSCNCMVAEHWRTHGLSSHPLYSTWYGMHHRCENPADQAYEDYGARGITVCERWHGLPDGLLNCAADMGPRPAGFTIDRRDNDGGYWCGHCAECVRLGRPANAVWGTQKEQTANRRNVRTLTRERDALAAEVAELRRLLG